MGLDVYLKKCKNREAARALELQYEAASEKIWEEAGDGKQWEAMTDAEKVAARAACNALKAKLGLNEWGGSHDVITIEQPSHKYPDHLFKIGYFRSSYNGDGFNSVLRNQLGKDLYWVFDRDGDEYEFQPNWKRVLGRAKELLAELRAHLESNGRFKVMSIHCGPFGMEAGRLDLDPPKSDDEALKLFQGQHREAKPKGGSFFDPPLKVRALIPGLKGGSAAVYAVCQGEGKRPLFDGLKAEAADLMLAEATIGDGTPLSGEQALEVFARHRNQHIKNDEKLDDKQRAFMGGSYGCHEGDFFFEKEPLLVRGLIPGTLFNTPALYCVYQGEFGWYINALEVVVEAFEHVLALPAEERKQIWVHWSA